MKDYAVLRIYFRGATEAHSIEYKDTLREAQTRFHNILAADEGNASTTYCLCMIFDKQANLLKSEIHDYREEKTAFYPVIRLFEDNEGMSNAVQIFTDDPANPGQALEEAIKRWHAVYANDINDNALLYNVAIMMDNNGMIGEYHKAWNHVKVQPEPEPEPTPDPESEVEPEGN